MRRAGVGMRRPAVGPLGNRHDRSRRGTRQPKKQQRRGVTLLENSTQSHGAARNDQRSNNELERRGPETARKVTGRQCDSQAAYMGHDNSGEAAVWGFLAGCASLLRPSSRISLECDTYRCVLFLGVEICHRRGIG